MNIESEDLDEIRRDARRRGKTITPDRLEVLRQRERVRVGAGVGRGPREPKDRAGGPKSWSGRMDAVSMPIVAEDGPGPFMTGDDNNWLFPLGAASTGTGHDGAMPRRLAIGGWIYLRAGHRLVARAQFRGVEHRDRRVEHIASPGGEHEDGGPGAVLAVDPNSWEHVDVPLQLGGEGGQGYRYCTIVDDRPIFTLVGR